MDLNLHTLFTFNGPVIEPLLRGTAIYLLLFVPFRFVVRRELGGFSIADLLVLVLIAEAAQNAMSGEYTSIPEAALLLVTILGWNSLFAWLARRLHRIAPFVHQRRGFARPPGTAGDIRQHS